MFKSVCKFVSNYANLCTNSFKGVPINFLENLQKNMQLHANLSKIILIYPFKSVAISFEENLQKIMQNYANLCKLDRGQRFARNVGQECASHVTYKGHWAVTVHCLGIKLFIIHDV